MSRVDGCPCSLRGISLSARIFALTLMVSTLGTSGNARGQVGLADYPEPILARNSSSHFARIKDLALDRDGKELLSAGFDKVIHVWDITKETPTWIRTIRPPIFRGELGQIWSIALSPVELPGRPGQRLLAVGGRSPGTRQGAIVLMRYPGNGPPNANGAGEILGYLDTKDNKHNAKITKILFDKKGQHLISADMSGNINDWSLGENIDQLDTSKLQPVVSFENGSAIWGMVLGGVDDQWIFTGDSNGRIHRWDRVNRSPMPVLRFNKQPASIRCLAVSRDQTWVVATTSRVSTITGNSPAELWQVQMAGPTPPISLGTVEGTILAVDLSTDGRLIAVSEQKKPTDKPTDLPPIDGCEIKVAGIQKGGLTDKLRIVRTAQYPIEAVRFGPNSSLAIGGDMKQVVSVQSGPNFNLPRLDASGQGSVIWDVGFIDGKDRAIAFSREPKDYGGKSGTVEYEGFNLSQRRFERYPKSRIFRPDAKPSDARVEVLDRYRFKVTWPRGSKEIPLDLGRDGRWYSYVLLPSLVPGGNPLLAVGTDSGISVFNAGDGKRTRFLVGHEDRVTALGVSPDRKWLVSGSADQSIRLWSIDKYEQVTGFGASGRLLNDGDLEVTDVIKGGDAEERGLQKGDRIKEAAIETDRSATERAKIVPNAQFFALAEGLDADQLIELKGLHVGGDPLYFSTHKRQTPTLSFFIDQTRLQDWVIWIPKGIYATSIAGDSQYLGWHQNKMKPGKEKSDFFPDTEKTVFSSIAAYKKQLENPNFIDQVIATGFQPPPPPPPKVVVASPVIEQQGEDVVILLPNEDQQPNVELFVNSKPLQKQVIWFKNGKNWEGKITKEVLKPFAPNPRVWARRVDPTSDPSWTQVTMDPIPTKAGKIVIFGCGVEQFPSADGPEVKFAKHDVDKLSSSLLVGLGAPKGLVPGALNPQPRITLTNEPTTAEFQKELDKLTPDRFDAGDVLLAILETRTLFISENDGKILLRDSDLKDRSVTTEFFRERLAEIAKTGCRVFLFLDDVHEEVSADARRSWIRQLLDDGVTCFMASESKPSWPRSNDGQPWLQKNRLFADSILKVIAKQRKPLTFLEFADAVRDQAEVTFGKKDLDSMIQARKAKNVDLHERFLK